MLETDGHFREKLQAANSEDIKVRPVQAAGGAPGSEGRRTGFPEGAAWLQPSQRGKFPPVPVTPLGRGVGSADACD